MCIRDRTSGGAEAQGAADGGGGFPVVVVIIAAVAAVILIGGGVAAYLAKSNLNMVKTLKEPTMTTPQTELTNVKGASLGHV